MNKYARSVILFATLLLAFDGAAEAQQPKKVPLIGYLPNSVAARESVSSEGIRLALRERGYIEGQHIAIEYRFAEGKPNRYSELADELVGLKVDVIASPGPAVTRSAKEATSPIPIFMAQDSDPGADGANRDTGSVNFNVIRREV